MESIVRAVRPSTRAVASSCVLAWLIALLLGLSSAAAAPHSGVHHRVRVVPLPTTGVVNRAEPSQLAPTTPQALAGFVRTYVNDFTGAALPEGWDVYGGNPGGDPGAQFGPGHVSILHGLLQLSAWPDPAYGGEWVTGGLCQCGHAQTYGAYFVRTRVTGPGPTTVELLWPAAKVWPPEVDFVETNGGVTGTTATVHYGAKNNQIQYSVHVAMQRWHTYGIIWTPGQLTYLVDGRVYASVNEPPVIPGQGMTLDLQQQTWCLSAWACPSHPETMQVDWVAEYRYTGAVQVSVGPFVGSTWSLSATSAVASLAADVSATTCRRVTLTSFNPAGLVAAKRLGVAVARQLHHDLGHRVHVTVVQRVARVWRALHVKGVLWPSGRQAQVLGRVC